jgi:hypothetical protein
MNSRIRSACASVSAPSASRVAGVVLRASASIAASPEAVRDRLQAVAGVREASCQQPGVQVLEHVPSLPRPRPLAATLVRGPRPSSAGDCRPGCLCSSRHASSAIRPPPRRGDAVTLTKARGCAMGIPAWLAVVGGRRGYRWPPPRRASRGRRRGVAGLWCRSSRVRHAFGRQGIEAPWEHQVAAAEAAHAGHHVALATGTASGKSLAYLLPVLAATADGVVPDGCRVPGARGRALRVARAESAHGLVSLPHQGPRPRPASRL